MRILLLAFLGVISACGASESDEIFLSSNSEKASAIGMEGAFRVASFFCEVGTPTELLHRHNRRFAESDLPENLDRFREQLA